MRTTIGVLSSFLLLLAPAAGAETHTVNQTATSFEPDEMTIAVGDTVEWVWSSLSHTVTNGTDPSDPEVGTMFDVALDEENPTVSFTFTEAGDVPYFCRPHFSVGMTGVIHVEETTPVEPSTWARIKDERR